MNIKEIRPILLALYPVAAILAIATVLEPALRVWPLRFGDVGWRFGAAGLAANTAAGVLFSLGLLVLIAAMLGHLRTVRTLSVVATLLGVLAFGTLILFTLDFLQLRPSVRAEMAGGFSIAAVQAMFLMVISGLSSIVLGIAGWRTSRQRTEKKKADAGAGVLLQQQPVMHGGSGA